MSLCINIPKQLRVAICTPSVYYTPASSVTTLSPTSKVFYTPADTPATLATPTSVYYMASTPNSHVYETPDTLYSPILLTPVSPIIPPTPPNTPNSLPHISEEACVDEQREIFESHMRTSR